MRSLTAPSSPGTAPLINPRAHVILALAATVLTAVVLATLAGVVIVKRHIAFRHHHPAETLELIASNTAGDGAFISSAALSSPSVSAAAAQQISSTNEQLPASPERGIRLVAGTHPGMYGVVGQQSPCDPASITNALDSRSDVAQAWAQVQGIQPEQIPHYINTLTPVVLTADTWVTAHVYAAGRATATQSILQAGSAVMIDPAGVPRVRCMSGTPLRPPANENIAGLPQSKSSWPGYSAQNVVAIAYTNAPSSFTDPVPTRPATEFSVIDLDTGTLQTRKAGGTLDIPAQSISSSSLPDPIATDTPP